MDPSCSLPTKTIKKFTVAKEVLCLGLDLTGLSSVWHTSQRKAQIMAPRVYLGQVECL